MKIAELTKEEIHQLRKEVCLNSLFTGDYKNTLGVDKDEAYNFFDNYVDYIYQIAEEDDAIDTEFVWLDKYDTEENLESYFEEYKFYMEDC